MLPGVREKMTDKKRGRPTVKKKDEHHITGCSLPSARVCIDYRNRERDVVLAFREKYGDDMIIREYEALSDPTILSAVYVRMTDALVKSIDVKTPLLITATMVIPAAVTAVKMEIIKMGAAYYDICLEKEGK